MAVVRAVTDQLADPVIAPAVVTELDRFVETGDVAAMPAFMQPDGAASTMSGAKAAANVRMADALGPPAVRTDMTVLRLVLARGLGDDGTRADLVGVVAVLAREVATHAHRGARAELERETFALRTRGHAAPIVGAFSAHEVYEAAFRHALRSMADALRAVCPTSP